MMMKTKNSFLEYLKKIIRMVKYLGGMTMNRKNMVQENTACVNTVNTMNQQKNDDTSFIVDEIQFYKDIDDIIDTYIFDDDVAK